MPPGALPSPSRPTYLQVRRQTRQERVDRITLLGHQGHVELLPVIRRGRGAKSVNLAVKVIDDVLLRPIQLLLRRRWEQPLGHAHLDLNLAADLPRIVAIPTAQRKVEVLRPSLTCLP
jgi:hypothetical protein